MKRITCFNCAKRIDENRMMCCKVNIETFDPCENFEPDKACYTCKRFVDCADKEQREWAGCERWEGL